MLINEIMTLVSNPTNAQIQLAKYRWLTMNSGLCSVNLNVYSTFYTRFIELITKACIFMVYLCLDLELKVNNILLENIYDTKFILAEIH